MNACDQILFKHAWVGSSWFMPPPKKKTTVGGNKKSNGGDALTMQRMGFAKFITFDTEILRSLWGSLKTAGISSVTMVISFVGKKETPI